MTSWRRSDGTIWPNLLGHASCCCGPCGRVCQGNSSRRRRHIATSISSVYADTRWAGIPGAAKEEEGWSTGIMGRRRGAGRRGAGPPPKRRIRASLAPSQPGKMLCIKLDLDFNFARPKARPETLHRYFKNLEWKLSKLNVRNCHSFVDFTLSDTPGLGELILLVLLLHVVVIMSCILLSKASHENLC